MVEVLRAETNVIFSLTPHCIHERWWQPVLSVFLTSTHPDNAEKTLAHLRLLCEVRHRHMCFGLYLVRQLISLALLTLTRPTLSLTPPCKSYSPSFLLMDQALELSSLHGVVALSLSLCQTTLAG